MSRLAQRINIALTCNWLAIAWHCKRAGHDWDTIRLCWCRRQTSCRYCGKLRGFSIVGNDDDRPACNFHRERKAAA